MKHQPIKNKMISPKSRGGVANNRLPMIPLLDRAACDSSNGTLTVKQGIRVNNPRGQTKIKTWLKPLRQSMHPTQGRFSPTKCPSEVVGEHLVLRFTPPDRHLGYGVVFSPPKIERLCLPSFPSLSFPKVPTRSNETPSLVSLKPKFRPRIASHKGSGAVNSRPIRCNSKDAHIAEHGRCDHAQDQGTPLKALFTPTDVHLVNDVAFSTPKIDQSRYYPCLPSFPTLTSSPRGSTRSPETPLFVSLRPRFRSRIAQQEGSGAVNSRTIQYGSNNVPIAEHGRSDTIQEQGILLKTPRTPCT